MMVSIISTIVGAIIFLIALYYLYTMYFSKNKNKLYFIYWILITLNNP